MLATIELSNEVVITATLALTGAIGVMFKLLTMSYEQRIKASESVALSYKEIAEESLEHLQSIANRQGKSKSGKSIPPQLKPVVPEHHSATTPEQKATAELATDRAKLTALTLALDLPIRKAAPMEASVEAKKITDKAEEITDKAEEITSEAKKITDKANNRDKHAQ